jgi:hypothetical protein
MSHQLALDRFFKMVVGKSETEGIRKFRIAAQEVGENYLVKMVPGQGRSDVVSLAGSTAGRVKMTPA